MCGSVDSCEPVLRYDIAKTGFVSAKNVVYKNLIDCTWYKSFMHYNLWHYVQNQFWHSNTLNFNTPNFNISFHTINVLDELFKNFQRGANLTPILII